MFLKAGAVSLALLLASRLLGLARESAQAAAFGSTGLADVAVLLLTLPDWLTSVVASGALAYVLVPAWAGQAPPAVARSQRRVARGLLLVGLAGAVALALGREPVAAWLAGGLPADLRAAAASGLVWSSLAFPPALLAALWATRLQHERDFLGLYGANLVVNGGLIAAIALAGWRLPQAVPLLGAGLLAAMGLRLAWQWRRLSSAGTPAVVSPDPAHPPGVARAGRLPAPPVWAWAVLSAGLPLALPFAARSIASLQGEGGLATFNYAWKLVELPLVLAIQLVATLAFPAVAAAVARGLESPDARQPLRVAFALAWALACAAAAGLLVGADALASLLFGWGRMDAGALAQVAAWGRVAAWGLLPQAVGAVALTVLASQQRMRLAAVVHGLALAALLVAPAWLPREGESLMWALDGLFALIALVLVGCLGPAARACLPWRLMAVTALALLAVAGLRSAFGFIGGPGLPGLALACMAGVAVLAAGYACDPALKAALRR